MTTATKEQIAASVEIIKTLAEIIREVKQILSGHLYAQMMPFGISLDSYEKIIGVLVRTGLVKQSNHLLTWVGEK